MLRRTGGDRVGSQASRQASSIAAGLPPGADEFVRSMGCLGFAAPWRRMLTLRRILSRVRLFVGFSDDRRLQVLVRFGIIVFVFVLGIIIIVGVTGACCPDGDEPAIWKRSR